MPTNRLRRAYNWCYIRARPIRRALRDPKQRYLILKWSLAGMLAYLLLYTSFYIVLRNEYLFGMSTSSSELMELYTSDLKACWHAENEESVATKLPMQISFHNEHTLQAIRNVNNFSEIVRNVLVVPHKNHVYGEHIDTLLDAGMCIATPTTTNRVNQNSQRSQSSAQSNTSAINIQLNLRTIDSTRYTTRCLPHFIIAGAMKCGTGELMKWLQLHPNLAVGSNNDKRELHYFTGISGNGTNGDSADANSNNGSTVQASEHSSPHNLRDNHTHNNVTTGTYKTNHTKLRRLTESHTSTNHSIHTQHVVKPSKLVEYAQFFPPFDATQLGNVLTFEKSPDYIRDTSALKLIHKFMPSIKIIILLRNPVLRALSEFSHHCRHQRYIKLTKDVTIDSKHYATASVLRNDIHSIHSDSTVPVFPADSYEVLTYPCSAADAEVYFNMHNSMHHHKSSLNTTYSSANRTTTTNSVNLLHNVTMSTQTVSSRVHYVPELEHGLYDHQLTALYEIFPSDQILVLLQEDMYSHTFRTLRQVESFLKIGCFDYQEYAIIPTNSVSSKPTFDTDGEEAGDDSLTDDMNINMQEEITGKSKNPNTKEKSSKKKGRGKGHKKKHLKPPRRAPRTYDEKMRHYKAELAQYLASWKGLSMTPSVNIYDNTSPAFKEYLHAVYTSSNNKLSDLLHGKNGNEAFSKEHLEEMGWDMGV